MRSHSNARATTPVGFRLRSGALFAFGMMTVICSAEARAADLVGHEDRADQASVPWLLGDWNGTRTRLRDAGVDFQFSYVGEVASNATGGLQRQVAYADQWAAGVTLDLGRLGLVQGGTVQVTYTDRNGRNLSDDAGLGTLQEVQEIYGRGRTARLTRFWYNQKFADGLVEWKIGRMPFSEDFSAFSCDFQNLTFCGTPAGNIVTNTIYNWPISQWATRLKFNLEGFGYFQFAAFDQNSKYLGLQQALLPVFFSGCRGSPACREATSSAAGMTRQRPATLSAISPALPQSSPACRFARIAAAGALTSTFCSRSPPVPETIPAAA
jgi:porin